MVRDYFGNKYDEAMAATAKAKRDATSAFLKKHPYADMSKFRVFVNQGRDGLISSTDVDYIIDDVTLVGVDTDTFRRNPKWVSALNDWPSPWGVGGTVQDFAVGSWSEAPNVLDAFVTEELSFRAELAAFDITNPDGGKSYKDNGYLASLYAAYIATYACGISTHHFPYGGGVPGIVTSIARYHLYYHMMRFLRQPSKMSRYITEDIKKLVLDHKPTKGIWEDGKFDQGQENLGS